MSSKRVLWGCLVAALLCCVGTTANATPPSGAEGSSYRAEAAPSTGPKVRLPAYHARALALPPGGAAGMSVTAVSLNDAGQALIRVEGAPAADQTCYVATVRRARWLPVPDPGSVGGTATQVRCRDLADDGTVVGSLLVAGRGWLPVAWPAGGAPVPLEGVPEAWDLDATATDSTGSRIYGHAWFTDAAAALVWDRTGALVRQVRPESVVQGVTLSSVSDQGLAVGQLAGGLGTATPIALRDGGFAILASYGFADYPTAISPDGQTIVGVSSPPAWVDWELPTGVFFQVDGPTVPIPSTVAFLPADVNNSRRIVGRVQQGAGAPAVWVHGTVYDLNAVTTPRRATITTAGAINEDGDIAAVGDLGSGRVAVVLDARR